MATARAAATRSIAGMLAGGVATLAAYGFAMLMLPGLFRLAPMGLPVNDSLAVSVLAATPASPCSARFGIARLATAMRAGAALGVAGVVALALGRLLATGSAMPATAWHEFTVLAVLCAVAAVLWAVLGQGAGAAPVPNRRSPRAFRRPATDGLTGLPTRQFFEGG